MDNIVVNASRQEMLLEEVKHSANPAIIYGASVYAYVLYKYLTAKGIEVNQFAVDKAYKTADEYMDISLVAIEDLLPNIEEYNVFVGVANYPAVVERFASMGITGLYVIDVPDFLNIPRSFMDQRFVQEHEQQLQHTYELFDDELSKQTFIAAINTKLNDDLSFIKPFVRPDHLYFTKTEFPVGDNETLLDVGGYNGDSIRDFYKITNSSFNKIISLEPFPKMYEQLKDTISELGIRNRCIAVQSGAWNEKATLSFANTEAEIDSKITQHGGQQIEVDTIDNILAQLSMGVSYIKMDINGAEFNALSGARRTIKTNSPRIAVKLHVKEDFYRLPILLKDIAPDIKLYLRQRNFMSMMLVVYGVFQVNATEN